MSWAWGDGPYTVCESTIQLYESPLTKVRETNHKPRKNKHLRDLSGVEFRLIINVMNTDKNSIGIQTGQDDRMDVCLDSTSASASRSPGAYRSGSQDMRKLAISVAVVSLAGLWVQPFLSPAREPATPVTDALAVDLLPPTVEVAANQTKPLATTAPASVTPAISTFPKLIGTAGHWRLGQDATGVWWLISPKDEPEFLNAITTVQPYQRGRDADGAAFVSRDWIDPSTGKPNEERWASRTLDRVKEMGFKALGAWCHPVFHQLDVPITRDLNVWTWIPPQNKRLYDPKWPELAEYAIKTQTEPLRDNANVIGYFIDNELDWTDASSGPGVYFDGLPIGDPNRAQVLEQIQQIWKSIEDFNTDWGTTLSSFDELAKQDHLPSTATTVGYRKLRGPWLERMARDYFRITTTLIRKHDPNHLILGVRYKGYAPIEVTRASRGLTDVQSLNYYVNDALLDPDMFREMYEASGHQPIILSEYSFHSLDGRSGNRNVVGFAAQVMDQQARADAYRMFTTGLARVPYVIGADWFQWSDEPPSGRLMDGEDVNFGMVDVDDRPYEQLADTVREVSGKLNGLHARSASDKQAGVWRESFATKPVMEVPFLSDPITLNGELSDWSMSQKIDGIRHSQTVGLERSKLPLPNIYMAWNHEGLYFGIEVFDNDTLGAPANGWWWTRDNVEIFLNTRPVPADQKDYGPYSHQFFFVPIDFPGSDGAAGTVGQWHRPGSAISGHKIPHPDIRKAARVLPDRYVVEMFIPAGAMNGFEPTKQPNLAMNVCVTNFQHATTYFWSAPKEVQTQLKPNSWGTLQLNPAPEGANAGRAKRSFDETALIRP